VGRAASAGPQPSWEAEEQDRDQSPPADSRSNPAADGARGGSGAACSPPPPPPRSSHQYFLFPPGLPRRDVSRGGGTERGEDDPQQTSPVPPRCSPPLSRATLLHASGDRCGGLAALGLGEGVPVPLVGPGEKPWVGLGKASVRRVSETSVAPPGSGKPVPAGASVALALRSAWVPSRGSLPTPHAPLPPLRL